MRSPRSLLPLGGLLAMLLLPLAAAHAATGPLEGVRLAPATPGGVRFTVSVPEAQWRVESTEPTVQRLTLTGYEGQGRPGEPELPVRVLLVAVPPLGDVRVSAVASEAAVVEGVTLAPVPTLDAERLPNGRARRPEAYGAAGSAEPVAARLLDVTWMRNQRVARIAIEPAAYEPALRRFTLARRVDVDVNVTTLGDLGTPAEPDDPFERLYRASLLNYQQGRAWRRTRTADLAAAAKRSGVAFAATAALAAPPDTSVFAGRTWIKFAVQKSGFVSVNYSRLRNLALFGAGAAPALDSLRLFTWPGVTVLPEDSYCDSCDYREVAIGISRDSSATDPNSVNGDGKFNDNNDTFFFFAQGPDGWQDEMNAAQPDTAFLTHPYDKSNYYYLTIATAEKPVTTTRYPVAPRRIATKPGQGRDVAPNGSETPVATVEGRVHREQDNEFWPDASAVHTTMVWEKWFWRSLTVGQTFTDTLDLPDADTTAPARFRLRQWGLSRNSGLATVTGCTLPPFDHQLDVSFNTTAFPREQWFGIWSGEQAARTFEISGTFLKRAKNVMRAAVPFYTVPGCSAFLDLSGLAWYEVHYDRFPVPANDAIDFRTKPLASPGVQRLRYDIGPFVKSPTWVFDLTDPLTPVLLEGGQISGSAGAFTLAIADTQSMPHRYAVVPDSVLRLPVAMIPANQISDAPFTSLQNLRSPAQQADYLVIYYDGFKAAADSLAAWRSQHLPLMNRPAPYAALAVPISAVYDQFSGGRTDPGALRNFLRAASGWSRRPLYVTFLGDASFDFKDITGRAVPGQPACLLPTYENGFDEFGIILRQYASDDWILNVDDAVRVLPDYLGARIPANDVTGALAVVTGKILGYERSAPFGEYRNSVTFFADDDVQTNNCDPIGFGHVEQTDGINRGSTAPELDRNYVYMHTYPVGPNASRPLARQALIANINNGTTLLNYVGHGSPFKMSDEGVFLDSDAGTLTNGLKLGLLTAASCDVGKFNDPTVQSLGERMFMSAEGGSIGVISATELALSSPNIALNANIYQAMFNRDTVSVAGVFQPATGQYELPISAALLLGKVRTPSSTVNALKFELMGDAGTRLNLPRLWTDIAFTDTQGAPVSAFAAGQTVLFSGRVLDRPGGTLVPLDGIASVLLEDSAPFNSLRGAASDPSCVSFRDTSLYLFAAGPMYHGDVSLKAGLFQGRFVVPVDATTGTRGRARVYVNGVPSPTGGRTDGAGSVVTSVVPGTPPTGDNEGPTISLGFVGGATNVRGDATLLINLFDESGIMSTGHAAQNSIVVTVDGNTTSRTDVTSTFRYNADSYQAGTARFQLPNLEPGPHQVRVSAADNLATGLGAVQHRNSATLDFAVADTPDLRITRTFLFPSPVRSGGNGGGGVFVVDAPGDSVNTFIRVYTVAGKLVRELKQMGGLGQVQVVWDGLDDEGQPLAQGTYLYKVHVGVRDADGKSSARQRATAQGRFVVLNR